MSSTAPASQSLYKELSHSGLDDIDILVTICSLIKLLVATIKRPLILTIFVSMIDLLQR